MRDYEVIMSSNYDDFEHKVNQSLLQGYILVGGVNVDSHDQHILFSQAVAKKLK